MQVEVMEVNIPQNQIPVISPYPSDQLGDFVSTFNIDLTSNLGAIRTTRMNRNGAPTATPNDIAYYGSKYYYTADGGVYQGGNSPEDAFTLMTGGSAPTDITDEVSSLEEFNGYLYVIGTGNGDGIVKYNGSWSTVSAAGLNSSSIMHLSKTFGNLLYITDVQNVVHVTAADALNLTGTSTFNPGLSSSWIPTFLDASFDSLFVGYLNVDTGKGIIYEWDGSSENTATRKFELASGPLAGCIKDNIPYIVDTRGRLMAYSGTAFIRVASLNNKEDLVYRGVDDSNFTIERPVHPHGMDVTDTGRILILFNNPLSPASGGVPTDWDNTNKSGVYEYDENIGLYHKYSPSYTTASVVDYGSMRLNQVGALFFRRPNTSPAESGTFLCGASIFTDDTTVTYSVFYDDNQEEFQHFGSFETTKIFSSHIKSTWNKIYVIFKNLLTSTDKIVVKYRVKDSTKTEATCLWDSTNRLITNTDLSAFSQGDEVEVIQGTGAGKTAHITSIDPHGGGYTVVLDDDFANVTGNCKVFFDNWRKFSSDIDNTHTENFKELSSGELSGGSFIQIKVSFQSTGKNEIYKLKLSEDKVI